MESVLPRAAGFAAEWRYTAGCAARTALAGERRRGRSPISGVLLSWHVEESQQVSESDPIAMMEAMKMETQLYAALRWSNYSSGRCWRW